jgi:hypothetical protein
MAIDPIQAMDKGSERPSFPESTRPLAIVWEDDTEATIICAYPHRLDARISAATAAIRWTFPTAQLTGGPHASGHQAISIRLRGHDFDSEARDALAAIVKPKYTHNVRATAMVMVITRQARGVVVTLQATDGAKLPSNRGGLSQLSQIQRPTFTLDGAILRFLMGAPFTPRDVQIVCHAAAVKLGLYLIGPITFKECDPAAALLHGIDHDGLAARAATIEQ